MDSLTVLSDILDNQNLEFNFGYLSQMANDYENKILMQELTEELNS
jgi:hypothetical protein